MFHGVAFLLLAIELVWAVWGGPPMAWLVMYPVVSFAMIGVAYIAGWPQVFGKRANGAFGRGMYALHLPFHIVGGLSAALLRLRSEQDRWHEIVDGLWLGARTNTLPPGLGRIVDLTAEHARVGGPDVDYVLIATLDGRAPDEGAMRAAIAQMQADPRPTYVHCFAGKGRSATFVAAYLLQTGVVETVEAAELFMQERRPVVRLGEEQREVASRFES